MTTPDNPGFARPAAAAERGHVRECYDIRGSKKDDRARPYGRSLLHSEREMRVRGKQELLERRLTRVVPAETSRAVPAQADSLGSSAHGPSALQDAPMTPAEVVASAEALVEPESEPRMPFTREGSGSSGFQRQDTDRYPMPDIPEVGWR